MKPPPPHGTRYRYNNWHCRCDQCRQAQATYQRQRCAAQGARLVSIERAREHILNLSRQGVGRRAVAAAADLHPDTVYLIGAGRMSRIRADTETAILDIDASAISDHALVPARGAKRCLKRLMRRGYTTSQLARWLGYRNECLHMLAKKKVTARTASRVEQLERLIEDGRLSRD